MYHEADLRPVIPSKLNKFWISFCYRASLNLTKAIHLHGHTKLVNNLINQLQVPWSGCERVHIWRAAFASNDWSQTWKSLKAAVQHTLNTRSKLILDKFIQKGPHVGYFRWKAGSSRKISWQRKRKMCVRMCEAFNITKDKRNTGLQDGPCVTEELQRSSDRDPHTKRLPFWSFNCCVMWSSSWLLFNDTATSLGYEPIQWSNVF